MARDQFRDPQPVHDRHWFHDEGTGGQVAEETNLRLGPQSGGEQVDDLRDDQGRDHERTGVGLQQLEARGVVSVVGVDVCVQRAGVDGEGGYRLTSAARISSIRSDTSWRPLRPAAAAPRRRRPDECPRYASSASRLMSAMVVPRRSASCRRRASSASGNFTVVRFTYASMPPARQVVADDEPPRAAPGSGAPRSAPSKPGLAPGRRLRRAARQSFGVRGSLIATPRQGIRQCADAADDACRQPPRHRPCGPTSHRAV